MPEYELVSVRGVQSQSRPRFKNIMQAFERASLRACERAGVRACGSASVRKCERAEVRSHCESLPVINMIDEKMPGILHQETVFVRYLRIRCGNYGILRVFRGARLAKRARALTQAV